VLGGYGYSSDAIREKVRLSAEQIGYRPNLLARGLITGKTRTIGVVAGDIQSPFYASVLRGVADVARAQGFGVLVTNSDETLELELEAVQLLMESQVDGMIVSPCDTKRAKHLRRAIEDNCPIVQFDRVVKGLAADSVTVNNRAASRDCVEQLIAAGHRRIAIIGELIRWDSGDVASFVDRVRAGAIEPKFLYPSWQRLFGYVEAHLAAGMAIDLNLIGRVGAYSRTAAKTQALNLLSRPHRPTAIFSADGLMSAGAMDAIAACDMRMPEDLSLIGFDDLDWMSFLKPGVTAVVQPLMAMGEIAARLMLDRIASREGPIQHVTLETSLARRGSVAAPGRVA
jgi:LacI family transcriptional regulator